MAACLSLYSTVVGEMDIVMYNRDFGGVRSDGQLNEFENNWKNQYSGTNNAETQHSQKTNFIQNELPQKQYTTNNRRNEPKFYQAPLQDEFYSTPPPVQEACTAPSPPPSKGLFNFNLDFLRKIEMDDLVLIAIGILLLLDSDASNDMLIILIAFMLFF